MDKVVDSGSTDAGSIPVRDAKVDMSILSGFGISLFCPIFKWFLNSPLKKSILTLILCKS